MAISSLGIGSNLDLSGLLDKLAAGESQPLVALQKRQVSFTAKLSAYGTLQNSLSSFQAAASKLADANLFQGVKATSSATDVLSASATETGAVGSYAVQVTQLAQAQSLASTGQTSATTAIGGGTVAFKIGAGSSIDVVIGVNSTLEGVRDAINAKKDVGVTASIVNDGGTSPYRLLLVSSKSGEASTIDIKVTGGDAALEALLNNNAVDPKLMTETVQPKNAQLTVNGLAISSATNVVSESLQGVTMTLAKLGASTLTVSRDTASVESAVGAFVNAYNSLQGTASQLSRYDQSRKTGAALVGDSTLRSVQTSIRAALNTPQAGDLKVLSSVGVSFQKDGTLAFDAAKLKAAYADNRQAVTELFAGTGGNTGYGKQVAALVTTFTGTDGKLSNATAGVNTTLKSLESQYAATEVSVQAKVARYRAQFTQLDLMMSRMNSTTSYLTQQFSSMNKSN